VKPVAISSPARIAEYPDVPPLRELGFDLVADSWFGLSGPANLPPAIVTKLNAAVVAVMNAPDVRARLAGDAITPRAMSPAEFSAYVAGDIAKWRPVVRQLGLGQ
jgi:tripartite-type tricarboxylate transporter receptor subunit TctC